MAFKKCSPFRKWIGRYERIPGRSTCFYIKYNDNDWWPCITLTDDNNAALCWVKNSDPIKRLRDAVNEAKKKLNGQPGGSFIINEYRQIIVPSVAGERLLIGEIDDPLFFNNPINGTEFGLNSDKKMVPGQEWKKPYVGNVFHMNAQGNKIYAVISNNGDQTVIYPPRQDRELLSKLNSIRPGGCKFIVNPDKVVITKKQTSANSWMAVYVGNINPSIWFDKE